MKLIRTEDAVGHVLCHDLTQIIKDQYKDARFARAMWWRRRTSRCCSAWARSTCTCGR